MKLISIIGEKGGSGKTTLSHALAYGFRLLNVPAIMATTDDSEEPLASEGRGYQIFDFRDQEVRIQKVARAKAANARGYLILSGAGNRSSIDDWLYEQTDLTLLPVRDSEEDLRRVLKDLEALPLAFALPNAWPTNPHARKSVQYVLDQLNAAAPGQVLQPVPDLHAFRKFTCATPVNITPALRNACRALARQALEILEPAAAEIVDEESTAEPLQLGFGFGFRETVLVP
jgi:hypothetical protein